MRSFEKILVENQSLATSFTSSTLDISTIDMVSAELVVTGTPTGTLTIEASNSGTNFTILSTTALSGSAGISFYNSGATKIAYNFVRIQYVASSGTGALTMYFSAKGAS